MNDRLYFSLFIILFMVIFTFLGNKLLSPNEKQMNDILIKRNTVPEEQRGEYFQANHPMLIRGNLDYINSKPKVEGQLLFDVEYGWVYEDISCYERRRIEPKEYDIEHLDGRE